MLAKLWGTLPPSVRIKQEPSLPTEWQLYRLISATITIKYALNNILFSQKKGVLKTFFQPNRQDLPKLRDLPQHVGVLLTQSIAVNSSYASDVKVVFDVNLKMTFCLPKCLYMSSWIQQGLVDIFTDSWPFSWQDSKQISMSVSLILMFISYFPGIIIWPKSTNNPPKKQVKLWVQQPVHLFYT